MTIINLISNQTHIPCGPPPALIYDFSLSILPSATVVKLASLLCGCLFCNTSFCVCFINTHFNKVINTISPDPGPPRMQNISYSLSTFLFVIRVRYRLRSSLSEFVVIRAHPQQHHHHGGEELSITQQVVAVRLLNHADHQH